MITRQATTPEYLASGGLTLARKRAAPARQRRRSEGKPSGSYRVHCMGVAGS